MRDLILVIVLVGILVGVGLFPTLGVVLRSSVSVGAGLDPEGGVAQAALGSQTSPRLDLAQYRAESQNYSLEYLEEGQALPGRDDVRGESDAEVQIQRTQTTPLPAQLPATNPPYTLLGIGLAAILVAVIAYLVFK